MEKQKKNLVWLIPLIIGCVIGIIGLIMVIQPGNNSVQKIPSVTSPDFFENATEAMHNSSKSFSLRTGGICLMFFGFVMVALIGTLTTYSFTKAASAQRKLFKAAGGITKTTFESINQRIRGEKTRRYCRYCGSMIDEEKGACTGCGAKASKDDE